MLTSIALVLLTMVGYASGVALAGRGREVLPGVFDLLLLAGLWVVAFWLRAQVEARLLALLLGLALGLVVGFLFTAVRFARRPGAPTVPQSELPEHARERPQTAVASLPRRLWNRWNEFAIRMGSVQARLLMGYFYFIVVTPFALVMRLAGDPLSRRPPAAPSAWTGKEPMDTTIAAAREQG